MYGNGAQPAASTQVRKCASAQVQLRIELIKEAANCNCVS